MFDWGAFTLFLFILMRVSGFVLFNPIFGRNGLPMFLQAGIIGTLTVAAYYNYNGSVEIPGSTLAFGVIALTEMLIGLILGFVMRFFFYLADGAGEIVDSQMGLSMARTYDPSSQSQMTVTANMLNAMMFLLFFAENGHITLLRLMLTSGDIVPFGHVVLNRNIFDRCVELFAECTILAVKVSLPILAAEMLGQIGMGVLNKVIPQINVFVINIDLKILVGFLMLLMLITPTSRFLLEAEADMLREMRALLGMMHG